MTRSDVVVHEYFRVNPELVLNIVEHQLAPLAEKIHALGDS